MVLTKSAVFLRNFLRKGLFSRSSHSVGGIPGENMPFYVGRPTRLTIFFLIYFVPPFWAPYLVVTYQMLKE